MVLVQYDNIIMGFRVIGKDQWHQLNTPPDAFTKIICYFARASDNCVKISILWKGARSLQHPIDDAFTINNLLGNIIVGKYDIEFIVGVRLLTLHIGCRFCW